MIGRIALYGLFIALVAAAVWWKDDARIPGPKNLLAAALLLPLFAWVIWLRRDWAPDQAQRRAEGVEGRGGATPERSASSEITDAAGRP
jgi:hypothetical protein